MTVRQLRDEMDKTVRIGHGGDTVVVGLDADPDMRAGRCKSRPLMEEVKGIYIGADHADGCVLIRTKGAIERVPERKKR